jgi:septal ring factor EnvC (AmiA/AmiB activator)
MNKWVAITIIAVLAVLVIGGGYFLWQQTDKLGKAEDEVATLENNVSSLQGDLAASQAEASSLQGKLTASEATVTSLQADLSAANTTIKGLEGDLSGLRTTNSALSADLKKIQSPRHFSSLQELTDWLYKDDTNTKYTTESAVQKSFILQVRALRDGYLLPVDFYQESGQWYVTNSAVIGDKVYRVRASDDSTWAIANTTPIPSHPLE